ncbi:sugar phosphate nucleotidyltransferase, partial [Planctomycetota bacterium]
MVLAGGHGTRLHPLTADRAKPAVPFGAEYRIIDFILNNFVNSGIYSTYVLTQFKAQSLTDHIQRSWRFGAFLSDYFISLAPAQMFRYEELGPVWYRGTADAIYQCFHLIRSHKPEAVLIFGGDHIFKMNVQHMVRHHVENNADITIAGYPVPIEEASRFGVLQVSKDWKLLEFEEKPPSPTPIPGRPDWALASMGNYIFSSEDSLERFAEATSYVTTVPGIDLVLLGGDMIAGHGKGEEDGSLAQALSMASILPATVRVISGAAELNGPR